MMRATCGMTATILAVAAVLGVGAGAADADSSTGTHLVLWSEHNGVGDSETVPTPPEPGCVPLDAPFPARSARNDSPYTAELFLNADCTRRVETVNRDELSNFQRTHHIASVGFENPGPSAE